MLIGRFAAAILFGLLIVGNVLADGAAESDRNATRASSATKIANVESVPRSKIIKMSQKIDALIEEQLDSKKLGFNKPASDEIFLRRAYLDIAGRIPTKDEAEKFLGSRKKTKRADLVDKLLNSYGYVSRQFNFLADLLRVKSRVRNVIGQPYIDYIKDSLESNKPYDQMVRELLASEGPMMGEDNGQVGYYLRDVGMPEDNMSNTVRVFLGTRLECAQCHDHPYDKWTQRQYFEMVAFTGGMGYRLQTPDSEYGAEIAKLRGKVDERLRPIVRKIVEPMTYGIRGNGTGLARLPENFLGSDGEEFDIVKAKTMFEGKAIVDPPEPRSRQKKKKVNKKNIHMIPGAQPINAREAYARWMTDADNPRFAKVIANRMWKQAMGLALIEPVDVIEDTTVASNPQLMKYLTEIMIDLDFDLKQFLRVVYNTRAYNAEAFGDDVSNPQDYNFAGPVMRRMAAEQIWDSLLTLTFENVDVRSESGSKYRMFVGGTDSDSAYENLRKMSPDEILDLGQQVLDKGRKSVMKSMMMSGGDDKNPRKSLKQFEAQKRQMRKQISDAKKARDSERLKQLMLKKNEMQSMYKRKSRKGQLVRASELPSPAPAGHFLREFGQSDRETIENANTEPAVTQVLSLMNGYIESQIARNTSTLLMRNVIDAKREDKIDAVYLTMLSRKATPAEKSAWGREFLSGNGNGQAVMADLIWVLANSNEFIFVK